MRFYCFSEIRLIKRGREKHSLGGCEAFVRHPGPSCTPKHGSAPVAAILGVGRGLWGHPQRCQGVTACLGWGSLGSLWGGKQGGIPSVRAGQELGAAPKFCINPSGLISAVLVAMASTAPLSDGTFGGNNVPRGRARRTMGAGRAAGPRAPRPAGNPLIFHLCTETNTSSCLFPGRLYFGGWRWLPHAGGLTPAVPAGTVPSIPSEAAATSGTPLPPPPLIYV